MRIAGTTPTFSTRGAETCLEVDNRKPQPRSKPRSTIFVPPGSGRSSRTTSKPSCAAGQWLGLFNQYRSRYREGITLFEQAVRTFEDGSPTPNRQHVLILLQVGLGWLYIRLGQIERAQALLERARALYAVPDYVPLPGDSTDPDAPLGLICLIKGDYAGATRLAEAARRRNVAHGQRSNLKYALYVLTGAALGRGEYAEARSLAQQVHALTQETPGSLVYGVLPQRARAGRAGTGQL